MWIYSVVSVYLHGVSAQVAIRTRASFAKWVAVTIVESALSVVFVEIVVARSRPSLLQIVISLGIILVFGWGSIVSCWSLIPTVGYEPPLRQISIPWRVVAGPGRIVLLGRRPILNIIGIIWIISIARIVILRPLLKHLVISGLLLLFVHLHIVGIDVLHVVVVDVVDRVARRYLLAHRSQYLIFCVLEVVVGIGISHNVGIVWVGRIGHIFSLLEIQLSLPLLLYSLVLDVPQILARIIGILDRILREPLSFRLSQILIEAHDKSLGIIDVIGIDHLVAIKHRSLDIVIKVHDTVGRSLPCLVFDHCVGEGVDALLVDDSFHGVVERFETYVFHLVLFGEVAHCPDMIDPSGLLETHSQLF